MSLSLDLKNKISKIKAIVTDVDGVLTDAGLYLDENGNEAFAKFNIQDGYGTVIAKDCDLGIIVISGRKSLCTENRCKSLGVEHYYTGIRDKFAKLTEVLTDLNLTFEEVAYIGDDLIDLKAMNSCGFRVAPQDARDIVKTYAHYVTKVNGGHGVFREVVDLVLETNGIYTNYLRSYL